MQLIDVVDASARVGATRSRKEKVAALAAALGTAAAEGPETVRLVATYLSGTLRQRRTGLGWRSLRELPAAAGEPSLTPAGVDAAFQRMSELTGPGSQAARAELATDLFAAATEAEQAWLRAVIAGEIRQGALAALVTEAVAAASGVAPDTVRRAAMLTGSVPWVAEAALTRGRPALDEVRLEVGRPISPMLAGTAPDIAAGLAKVSAGSDDPVAVDTKLDGIRIQVHRDGDRVRIATRTLDDITDRLPEVVDIVRGLGPQRLVLDGEALALDADGRPRAFQETAGRTAQAHGDEAIAVTPYFFDLLHVDGRDLLDAPARERLAALADVVPERWRVPRTVTADVDEAADHARAAVASGHEGVVLKSLAAGYSAGRRGAGWVKVKPVHTVDLVVLAVERGNGRRTGWLSNIHLGARDPDTEDLVMVGKTFKGMTDEMLTWQTERFATLATDDDGYTLTLRPEQVVEIAFDGVQRSRRYAGGVALRFARVVRYRDDKPVAEVDTVDTLRAML